MNNLVATFFLANFSFLLVYKTKQKVPQIFTERKTHGKLIAIALRLTNMVSDLKFKAHGQNKVVCL